MKYLPKKVLEELYYKTVTPSVAYCISVWGNCSTSLFQNIEEIDARAARVIYDLPSQTSVEDSLMHARWQSAVHCETQQSAEDMKDEISNSLKAFDIFGLIFY